MASEPKFRNPVPGVLMKRPLGCIDLDPVALDAEHPIKTECQAQYLAKTSGKYTCPNLKANNGRCQRGTFLYPRRYSSRHAGMFHFHQGIDLGHLDRSDPANKGRKNARGLPVLSASDGIVQKVQVWDGTGTGYGNAVSVFDPKRGLLFWYAHLEADSVLVQEKQLVKAGEQIAAVGNSGNAGQPHLHFEVFKTEQKGSDSGVSKIIQPHGGPSQEQGIGTLHIDSPRRNPLEVLAELGPWGTWQLFLPEGQQQSPTATADLHTKVEQTPGGYFPLAANNFWHGGVHLPVPQRSTLHAPFDGRIVACRLGADETSSVGAFGHLGFILIEHELPQDVFDAMRTQGAETPVRPPEPEKPTDAKGGRIALRVKASNPPNLVRELAEALDARGHYDGDDEQRGSGAMHRALHDAVLEYQEELDDPYAEKNATRKHPLPWPDGVVDVPGYTWNSLFPPEPKPEPSNDPKPSGDTQPDPERTVYTLLMHLGPLDPADAAAAFPWLARARLPVGPGPVPLESTAEPGDPLLDAEDYDTDAACDDEDDGGHEHSPLGSLEGTHALSGPVAMGCTNTDDVRFVETRLIELGQLERPSPSGVADEAFEAAIVRFQTEYVWLHKPKFRDGVVSPGGRTDDYLRKTAEELEAIKAGGGKTKPRARTLHPAFAEALRRTDASGHAAVLSGLSIDVDAGEPLWISGLATGFEDDGGVKHSEEVHWEIFSEHLIFETWDEIDDADDDLAFDVPKTIVLDLDLSGDGLVDPDEIEAFYAAGDALDLRRTACRFRSEWDPNLDAALERIETLGFSTVGVRESWEPYLWWKHALDVLPPRPHVWHYNPIEFCAVYQEILDRKKPPEPPEPKDPTTHGHLVVKLWGNNGMPPKDPATVRVYWSGIPAGDAKAGTDGTATFFNLEVRDYDVFIDEAKDLWGVVSVHALADGGSTPLELDTPLPGKDPPRGNLTVWVRNVRGTAAKGARVRIEGVFLDREYPVMSIGGKSRVTFADLRAGRYTLHVEHDETPKGDTVHPNDDASVSQTIDYAGRKTTTTKIVLGDGVCDLRIRVDDGGSNLDGVLFDKQGNGTQLRTDGHGFAETRVPRGSYHIRFGEHSKRKLPALHAEVEFDYKP